MGIDETDLLLVVGSNPRTENPVLNARIRSMVSQNGLQVYFLGSAPDITYKYQHLGNSTSVLEQIADGNHPFFEKLSNAQLPMVVVSSNAASREDGEAIMSAVHKLASKTNLINEELAWNGVNILHNEASAVGALDIGIHSDQHWLDNNKPELVYLFGSDNIHPEDIPENAFVIYQGHSGDEGAYYADLILPSSSYLEKQATYVNTEGRAQQARAATTAPGFARDDWMIFRALSEELNLPLPYDSLDEVRTRIAELAPHLLKYEYTEPTSMEKIAYMRSAAGSEKMIPSPFTDPVDNFYMTDSISRNSSIMAKCTKELNPKKHFNFRRLGY